MRNCRDLWTVSVERDCERLYKRQDRNPFGRLTSVNCRTIQTTAPPATSYSWVRPGPLRGEKSACVSGRYSFIPPTFARALTIRGHLNHEQLLALFRLGNVWRHVRVHECLEARSPPCSQTVAHFPFATGLISAFSIRSITLRFLFYRLQSFI